MSDERPVVAVLNTIRQDQTLSDEQCRAIDRAIELLSSDERPDVQQAREKVIEAICLYRSGGEGTGAGVSNALNALVTAVRADSEAEIRRLRETFDFRAHLQRQREFSERTFGPGTRTAGVVDHICKELREIEKAPLDLSEWIDVVILALDGAWRAGHSPDAIVSALVAKQEKNEARRWPDWRTQPLDKAIEHDRAADTGRPER